MSSTGSRFLPLFHSAIWCTWTCTAVRACTAVHAATARSWHARPPYNDRPHTAQQHTHQQRRGWPFTTRATGMYRVRRPLSWDRLLFVFSHTLREVTAGSTRVHCTRPLIALLNTPTPYTLTGRPDTRAPRTLGVSVPPPAPPLLLLAPSADPPGHPCSSVVLRLCYSSAVHVRVLSESPIDGDA